MPTVRADLLRSAGRSVEAVVAYQEALDSPLPDAERRFLTRRLRELSSEPTAELDSANLGQPEADACRGSCRIGL